MPDRQILVIDTRRVKKSESESTYALFKTAAEELSLVLDFRAAEEVDLKTVIDQATVDKTLAGLILLRAPEAKMTSLEIEKALVQIDFPVVELFLDSLGHHQRIDQPAPGRKIIRTIYGRRERGIFWAMHFLLYANAYPYQTYSYGNLDSQIGDLMLPAGKGPYPVVMLIHGGFWRDGYYRDSFHGIAADLAKRGIAVWNIEYRRVGESGGGFPESHQDVLEALNYLKHLASDFPLDLKQVAVVGHSAGGYLSAWASSLPQPPLAEIMPAPQVPVRLSISLAGVTDLDEAHKHGGGEQAATNFLKSAAENEMLRQQLSVGYLTFATDMELLLAHGALDSYVPVELSELTCQILLERGVSVELLVFPDADHNEFVDPNTPEWQAIAARIEGVINN